MTAKKYPPLSNGTIVRTTKPNLEKMEEWTADGWASKQWGVYGTVVMYHDSHGLCYEVRHDDESMGAYDPTELEVIRENDEELKSLIQKYKRDQTLRDSGATARRTYFEIKKIATLKELVKILEEVALLR